MAIFTGSRVMKISQIFWRLRYSPNYSYFLQIIFIFIGMLIIVPGQILHESLYILFVLGNFLNWCKIRKNGHFSWVRANENFSNYSYFHQNAKWMFLTKFYLKISTFSFFLPRSWIDLEYEKWPLFLGPGSSDFFIFLRYIDASNTQQIIPFVMRIPN